MNRLTEADLARLLEAAHGDGWRAQAGCVTYRADDRLDYAVLVRAGHGTDADVELAAMAPALAREVLLLRARVAELEAERWPIAGTKGDERYTAHALLGRAVAAQAARSERRAQAGSYEPVWSGVRVLAGLGSGYAQNLCRAYGYHPDTGARLAATGDSDE